MSGAKRPTRRTTSWPPDSEPGTAAASCASGRPARTSSGSPPSPTTANRVYGRCGPGAVWGSKNLKAIRVRGKEKIRIHDKEKYQSGLDQALYLMKQAPDHQTPPPRARHGGPDRAHQPHQHAAPPEFPGLPPPRGGRRADLGRDAGQDDPRKAGCLLSLPDRLPAAHARRGPGRQEETGKGPEYETDDHDGPGLRHLRPRSHHPGQLSLQRTRHRHDQLRRDRRLCHGAL